MGGCYGGANPMSVEETTETIKKLRGHPDEGQTTPEAAPVPDDAREGERPSGLLPLGKKRAV